jgi:hypothetical protein
MKILRVAAVAFLLCAAAIGCKGKDASKEVKGVKVNGQLLANGKAVKMLPMEEIQVTFFEDGKPAEGRIESMAIADPATGTFTINGPSGKGIPAGRYRISLISEIYGGGGSNRFEEVFSMETSPLVVDVGPEEGQTIVIDLGKRTAKRQ